MTEIIAEPDIEDLLSVYLTTQFPTWGRTAVASTRIPDGTTKPAEFVRVLRVGGSHPTIVTDQPTVTVEGYAKLESKAFSLCALAGGLIRALPDSDTPLGGLQVYEVGQAGGIANLPDPRVPDRYRYTQTLTVHIRGLVLTV